MSKIGTTELILILVVALIVFGPSKLPELGRMAGKTIGQLKEYASTVTDEFESLQDEVAEKVQKSETSEQKETIGTERSKENV